MEIFYLFSVRYIHGPSKRTFAFVAIKSAFDQKRMIALSRAYWASLPEVSLALCFLSASLSQLAHYAAYLRLYP